MTSKNISSEPDDDIFIDEIYLYIGIIVAILIIVYSAVMIIRKCLEEWRKTEQNTQTTASLTRVLIIRRHSSVRNCLAPNRRTSLDVRFLMEARERRLSQSHLIPIAILNI